jgi:DNA primase
VAGKISDASLKSVRDAASIVDVAGSVVALRPAGSDRLTGLCPFHDEKRPSFGVSPSSNLFHCFGCGEGGDVITFVRKLDDLTFTEAVEQLAGRFNVLLTYEGGGQVANRETGKRQRLSEAVRDAAEFYAEQLATPDARAGRDFLSQRGFDRGAAEHFGVGFAPAGWDTLTKHLQGRGFSLAELTDAGLSRMGSRGNPIDRFHRRLLWPIRETTGGVVAFGARRLFDDDLIEAKYLNSPETPLFKKSSILYGADLARKAIAARSQAVVVEGYTDVMACHLSGVETAVATCGTAFGEDHVKLLRRLLHDQDEGRGEVVFTFDGDQAGQNAARKAMQFDQRFVVQTFVAIESEGRDPCELRQAGGDVAVRELVASRVPLVEFMLRSAVDSFESELARGTDQARSNALTATLPLLTGIRDRLLRDRYAARVAGWIGLEVEQVLAAVRARLGEGAAASPRADSRAGQPDDPVVSLERQVLKAALQRPGISGPAFDDLQADHFSTPVHRELRDAIAKAGGVRSAASVSEWIDRVTGATVTEETQRLIPSFAVEPLPCEDNDEQAQAYIAGVIDHLQELHIERRIRDVKARVQRTNPVTEVEVFNRLFGELISLEERKRQLRDRGLGPA